MDWNGKIINVVDVPGYFDFVGEMIGPLRVVETAVIVVDAVGGLSVGAEKAWITPVRMVWGACLLSTRWIAITRTSTRFRRSCARSTVTASCRFCCRWAKARPSRGVVNVLDRKAYEGAYKKSVEVPMPEKT